MEDTKKGGMSKGCLVGLIIAGVIVVVVIVAIVLMFVYKDSFVKMGSAAVTGEVKRLVAQAPPEGCDTASVNAFIDAFTAKMNQEDPLNLQGIGLWMQQVQPLIEGKDAISASDLETITEGMVRLYPDLESLRPQAAGAEIESPETIVPEGEPLETTPEAEVTP